MRGIVFSDLHLHNWTKFNEDNKRLYFQLGVLERMMRIAFKNDVPVFFGGDLYHQPLSLDNELLSMTLPVMRQIFNKYPADIYAIAGNHDLSKVNSIKRRSPSYINTLANTFKNFHVLDFDFHEEEDYVVFGVPYIHFNEGLMEHINSLSWPANKKAILLLHTDFRNQEDTNGIVVGKGEGLTERDFERFHLVLSGHIHKREHLRKNIYSIGAPMQIRLSDMGGSFGYWVLDDDLSMRFRDLHGPEFKFYTDEEEISTDTDFWVKAPKTDEELSLDAIDFIDLSDRKKIILKYLTSMGEKSKTKKRYLLKIIEESDE